MGTTGQDQIGCKYKGYRWKIAKKNDSKGSNINTDLMEYVPKVISNK